MHISAQVLQELMSYDHETGVITWKVRSNLHFRDERACASWNARFAGKQAFTSISASTGYRQSTVLRFVMRGHRVAWALHYGAWPNGEIDHINGDGADNRIANLRDVDRTENQKNTRTSRNNRSSVIGVTWDAARGKWFASIRANGRTEPLGRFNRIEDAAAARKAAEERLGFHQNHGRKA